jgi:hypothetical protein
MAPNDLEICDGSWRVRWLDEWFLPSLALSSGSPMALGLLFLMTVLLTF